MHACKMHACKRCTPVRDARLGCTPGMHAYKMYACKRCTPEMCAYKMYACKRCTPMRCTSMSHPANVYPESGLIFTPPKISHTGRHCVGWHAVVCYGAPEWLRHASTHVLARAWRTQQIAFCT